MIPRCQSYCLAVKEYCSSDMTTHLVLTRMRKCSSCCRRYFASLLFGAGLGGAATLLFIRGPLLPACMHAWRSLGGHADRAVHAGRRGDTEEPGRLHHALKYGAPSGENLRFFRNFVVSYDARLRNPRWVIEHISRDSTRGEAHRCLESCQEHACTQSLRHSCQ